MIKKYFSIILVVVLAVIATIIIVLPMAADAVTAKLSKKEIAACTQVATNKQKTAVTTAKAALKLAQNNYTKALNEANKALSADQKNCKIPKTLTSNDATLPATANTNNSSTPNLSCVSPTDAAQMDIFDSHVHISPQVSLSQIISEMDKAKVSVANMYSGTLEDSAKYPGRFIIFADTPDQPQPSTWLKQGQAFVASTEEKLKTGKYYGIGEANLRYYGGNNFPPGTPDINVSPDNPFWLQLVDLSAKYHVPISFHFVPDDPAANVAFETMLNHNKDATFIWAHLGFNNLTINSATLNDYLLRYPNLYFDTAGIQGMQNPLTQPNSNWTRITDQSGSQLNEEWKKFFETWNSRIMFATDAGGGKNSMERWQNYTSKINDNAPPDSVGRWVHLLSNLDSNATKNILSTNARVLFFKEKRVSYNYMVTSDGKCYHINVSSGSSVSALTFNSSARTITFTVADSNNTTGNTTVTIPTALAGGKFTVSVDGKSAESRSTSDATNTTVNLNYTGGIRLITLSAPNTP